MELEQLKEIIKSTLEDVVNNEIIPNSKYKFTVSQEWLDNFTIEFNNKLMEIDKEQKKLQEVQTLVDDLPNIRFISDGYHTFDELYEFRKLYNAALFNEWGKQPVGINENGSIKPKFDVHKSWKHYDGELCFGGGWFIVVAILPTGQITNHYKAEDWDLFKILETEKAKYEFDNHTPQDVLQRLKNLINEKI